MTAAEVAIAIAASNLVVLLVIVIVMRVLRAHH
jgi:hypothetical protein